MSGLFFTGKFTDCDYYYMAVNNENGLIVCIVVGEPRLFCAKTIAHSGGVVYNINGAVLFVAFLFTHG